MSNQDQTDELIIEPRTACFISELDRADDGGYLLLLCREGTKGYWRSEFSFGADREVAEMLVAEENRLLGLSPKEAAVIQAGTM